ncbi:MAG: monovalent cation/H+ antiporter subunit D family protein [Pseudomonadota bacterium]
MIFEQLPALIVAVPLLASVFTTMFQRGHVAWWITTLSIFSLPVMAWLMTVEVLTNGTISYAMGGWEPPIGIEYRIDAANALVILIVSAVAAVIMPYARASVTAEMASDQHAWFYTMYLLCVSGLIGIAATGDAFNAFVFLEISSLSTYTMIALGQSRRSLLAAYQYLIVGTIGATFYVIGVGLLYIVTGTLNFNDMAQRLPEAGYENAILAALAFITVGLGLKIALFPLHVWLPNAYAKAPSVATALLAATATKVAIYLLMRVFFSIYGTSIIFEQLPVLELMLILSITAMFAGSIVAVFENNAKRLMAYSSVAQVGYMTLGIAMASVLGLSGSLIHLANHAFMKGAAFLVLGAVAYRLGSVKISDMGGIGRVMPISMGCFVIAGLSLIGVPGTVGFISKYYLVLATFEKGWWWLAFLIVLSSLIAVLYVGRVVEAAWFKTPSVEMRQIGGDPPMVMLVPILLLTLGCVVFGIDASLTSGLAETAAQSLFAGWRQ